jgi:hypothetical protein
MRRAGSGFTALLGVGVLVLAALSGCAITPPVLGGTGGGGSIASGRFTDADVAALLILADDESGPGASTVADYLAREDADLPAVDPAACRNSAAPLLLLDRDAAAEGTVFEPPPLFRAAPGADLVVEQHARRFDSAEEASSFVAELQRARAACPEFESPDGRVSRTIETDDFGVPAVGFAATRVAADGSTRESFEWLLLADNVVISLGADLPDAEAPGLLRELAEEYAARLAA